MDIFKKTEKLKIVDLLKKIKLYPFFRELQTSKGASVTYKNKNLIMMSSNNYLNLTHDPRVIKAAKDAIDFWGTGCTGSRFLNGNLEIHTELEKNLASFLGFEACLVFPTGYMANLGALIALGEKGDYFFSDSENHACIIEGCRSSHASTLVYEHNDMNDLEEKLKSVPLDAPKMIISDGVFSMNGHIAKLDKISELAQKYQARVYIDDAHGLGTLGESGKGTPSHFNIQPDILMGTLSKTLGTQGGYVCGSHKVIEWIRLQGKTTMFSAALSPANTAAALKALEVLQIEPERVEYAKENAKFLKTQLDAIGFNTMNSETCIVPVFIGNDQVALKICHDLINQGVYATPVIYPAVPKGESTIRLSVISSHRKEDLKKVVEIFKHVFPLINGKQMAKTEYLHKLLDQNLSEEELMTVLGQMN